MIKNFFKVALRQLQRNKFYSAINILGLAIGLTSCLFIFFYVQDELSYDRFHKNKDRIYRISEVFKTGDGTMETGLTPHKLGPDLKRQFPEIEKVARVDFDLQRYVIKYGDKKFLEETVTSVEPDFFSVFSFPLIQGDPAALNDPYTVVITDEMSAKYFPGENAMGKVLEFIDPFSYQSFQAKVTGVMKAMPANSHFHKHFLLSAATADILVPERKEQLGWTSHFTYLLLSPQADPAKLEKAINDYIFKSYPKEVLPFWSHFNLLPLADIHLRSHLKEEQEANSDILYVYIFSAIALFIILLAAINYMNLSTARASGRAKEVGIRKVTGAYRRQLVGQFLAESVIITFIALIVAGLLVMLAMPAYKELTGKEFNIHLLQPYYLTAIVGATILIGLVSGSYPAFFLSAFKPVKVLKGSLAKSGRQSLQLRRGLVVLQFAISTILIISTITIRQQWHYLQSRKLGFASEQVITIQAGTNRLQSQYINLKNELLRNSSIVNVTASGKNLTSRFANYTAINLDADPNGKTIPFTFVDNNFFKAFKIPVVAGSDFPARNRKDTLTDFIINESAVKLLGITDPVGKRISAIGRKGRIIGVVKDFNLESLHTPVSPVVFIPSEADLGNIAVKISSADMPGTIQFIKEKIAKFDRDALFTYSFLDDNINKLYGKEAKFLQVFSAFSGLAIFIACLGIVGLAAFSASQRTKEIGIRKVLGASVQNVSFLLSKEFIKLVLLANIIAWPVAYYFMQRWLQDFPYRIEISIGIFILASLLALSIAILTVSAQAIKAALMNPVKSLKTE